MSWYRTEVVVTSGSYYPAPPVYYIAVRAYDNIFTSISVAHDPRCMWLALPREWMNEWRHRHRTNKTSASENLREILSGIEVCEICVQGCPRRSDHKTKELSPPGDLHLSSGASTMFIYYLWPVLFPIFTLWRARPEPRWAPTYRIYIRRWSCIRVAI